MQPEAGTDRAAMAATAVTVLLWASSFVAIRSGGHYFGPGALALGRLLAGSVVLGVIAAVRREGLPPRAAWPGIAAFGVLWFGVYMVALNWGEQQVDAGTASMTTSSIPLLVVVLSGLLLGEGFPRRLLGGIAVRGRCALPGWRGDHPAAMAQPVGAGQRRITVTWARVRTPAGSLSIPCW